MSEAAFEAAMTEWIVGVLPLQVGYEVAIVSFSLWDNREDTTTYRVTGTEMLGLRGRTADAWVVRVAYGPQDRAVRQRWIEKATGRTLQSHDAPRRAAPAGDGYWMINRLLAPPAGD